MTGTIWSSPNGLDHWQPEVGPCATCGSRHPVAAWTRLPEGYTLPGITPPLPPLCGHFADTPAGGSLDCPTRATQSIDVGRYVPAYACDRHATDDLSHIAGAEPEE